MITQLKITELLNPKDTPKRILTIGDIVSPWVVVESACCLLQDLYFDQKQKSKYVDQHRLFIYYKCLNRDTQESSYLELTLPSDKAITTQLIVFESLDESLRQSMLLKTITWLQEKLPHKNIAFLQEPGRLQVEKKLIDIIQGDTRYRRSRLPNQNIDLDPIATLKEEVARDAIQERFEDIENTIFLASRYVDPCTLLMYDQRVEVMDRLCCEINKPDFTLWLDADIYSSEVGEKTVGTTNLDLMPGRASALIRKGVLARNRNPEDPLLWVDAKKSVDETFAGITQALTDKLVQWGLL